MKKSTKLNVVKVARVIIAVVGILVGLIAGTNVETIKGLIIGVAAIAALGYAFVLATQYIDAKEDEM